MNATEIWKNSHRGVWSPLSKIFLASFWDPPFFNRYNPPPPNSTSIQNHTFGTSAHEKQAMNRGLWWTASEHLDLPSEWKSSGSLSWTSSFTSLWKSLTPPLIWSIYLLEIPLCQQMHNPPLEDIWNILLTLQKKGESSDYDLVWYLWWYLRKVCCRNILWH